MTHCQVVTTGHIASVSPDTELQTMDQQEHDSARKFMDKNMSSVLYAIAGTVLVLCILIHGCLFYRRWRLKRVRASVTGSPDRGWSWSKGPGKATSNEATAMRARDVEVGDLEGLVSSEQHSILPTKPSPSSSSIDQDLNERRRSSTRIKVLPDMALSRSSSVSVHSIQQKAKNGPDEGDRRVKEDELSSIFNKGLKMEVTEKGGVSKGISGVTPTPDDDPFSEYELIQCGTSETPKEQDTTTDMTCGVNTVPTILQTQPSEEHSEYHLLNADASGVLKRTNKDHPKELFKRRSYSFDNIPVFGAAGYMELQRNISATLTQGRSRSASESQGHSSKSQKNTVSFADKTVSETPKADPTYFTLIPDLELEPRDEKRYRTLPPVKSNDTTNESSSFIKRKFSLSSFKISRKNKKSQKKKNKTPPSSPARKSSPDTSSAIYEEPEFPAEPNPATCPVYFTLEQPNEEKSVIGKCEESILSKDSKTGTKSFTFKNSPKIRIKSKGTRNILKYKKKNPEFENLQNNEDAYEDLEAPTESTKIDETPVYDTLEPGPLAPPAQSNKNSGPITGRTTTGAPLRQFQPAHRELPSRPSQNVYDCFERGAFPLLGSNPRSQTLLPATRRGSSPASQRFNNTSSTTYDSLCPATLQEQLKATTIRRGSSPETSRHEQDAVYDLLNPDTFTKQHPGGSTKQPAPRPEISQNPKSLRLPRNSSLTFDTLHHEFQIRRGSLGARPGINTNPKSLLRTNSMSKIQKGRPGISPKPLIPQGKDSLDTKPALPKKPIINGNTTKSGD